MMLDNLPVEIYDALYQLGLTANYTGFFHIAYAVHLAVQSPQRLRLVTKWLYPDVAAYYNTTPAAVERNIRSVNNIIWQENRPLLEELAHRHLEQRPRNTQLLAILTAAIAAGSLGEKIGNLDEAPSREGTAAVAGRSCLSG